MKKWITARNLALLIAPLIVLMPLYFTNQHNHLLWTRFWLAGTVHGEIGPLL